MKRVLIQAGCRYNVTAIHKRQKNNVTQTVYAGVTCIRENTEPFKTRLWVMLKPEGTLQLIRHCKQNEL